MFMDTLGRFMSSEFNPFVIIISTVAAALVIEKEKQHFDQYFSRFAPVLSIISALELIECKCPPLCSVTPVIVCLEKKLQSHRTSLSIHLHR